MRKYFKKFIAAVCAAALLCVPAANAYDSESLAAAKTLFDIGLMSGSSETFSAESMDLDSFATRAQLAVVITRMLGKDDKACYQQNPHPFSDVPSWASPYVGWLYENYLAHGYSDTYYGANDYATLQQFSAMMLRALGYFESEGDFKYENAVNFAISIGLAEQSDIYKYELVRSDMVKICLKALKLPVKNSRRLLSQKLCDEKAISKQALELLNVSTPDALGAYFTHIENNLPDIKALKTGNTITVKFSSPVEHYGIRVFFISPSRPAVAEAPLNGSGTYYTKGKISYINGGSAGYINELTIHNFPGGGGSKIIVVKTTSEGASYSFSGKTNIISL